MGNKNFRHTEEMKRHLAEIKMAEKNPNWKGNNVGYAALHEWVKNRLPKPASCENCHAIEPHDLHNRSGKYLRDLSDWEWLCRKCHMKKDGRLEVFSKNHLRYGFKKGYESKHKFKKGNMVGAKFRFRKGDDRLKAPRRRKPKEASQ